MQVIMSEVESSNIHSIGFDNTAGKPGTGKLYVRFKSSPKIYKYMDVPFGVHIALMNAESKGKYFLSSIKPVYALESGIQPVEQAPEQPEDAKQPLKTETPPEHTHDEEPNTTEPVSIPRVTKDETLPDDAVIIRCGRNSFAKVVNFLDRIRIDE